MNGDDDEEPGRGKVDKDEVTQDKDEWWTRRNWGQGGKEDKEEWRTRKNLGQGGMVDKMVGKEE